MTPNPKKVFPPPNKNIYDGSDMQWYDFEELEQPEDEIDEEAERENNKYNKLIDEENGD